MNQKMRELMVKGVVGLMENYIINNNIINQRKKDFFEHFLAVERQMETARDQETLQIHTFIVEKFKKEHSDQLVSHISLLRKREREQTETRNFHPSGLNLKLRAGMMLTTLKEQKKKKSSVVVHADDWIKAALAEFKAEQQALKAKAKLPEDIVGQEPEPLIPDFYNSFIAEQLTRPVQYFPESFAALEAKSALTYHSAEAESTNKQEVNDALKIMQTLDSRRIVPQKIVLPKGPRSVNLLMKKINLELENKLNSLNKK